MRGMQSGYQLHVKQRRAKYGWGSHAGMALGGSEGYPMGRSDQSKKLSSHDSNFKKSILFKYWQVNNRNASA